MAETKINTYAGHLILNDILQSRDLKDYRYILDEQHFPPSLSEEVNYIVNHVSTYDEVPSMTAFVTTFEDWINIEVEDTPKYLIDELKKYMTFLDMRGRIQNLATKLEKGNIKGVEDDLLEAMYVIVDSDHGSEDGYDITKNSERLEVFEERSKNKDKFGISTGIKGIDDYTNGWHRGSLNIVAARPNKGKSWMVTKFALEAWKQGENVLMYSGEMSKISVGYSFDALNAGYNKFALAGGDDKYIEVERYKKYMESLEKNINPFRVFTPSDLETGMPTVKDIERLVIKRKPTVLIIDQISLLKSHVRGDERVKVGRIVRELLEMAKKYNLIIIAANQINRESANKKDHKKETQELKIPELHHLAESDHVGQHADTVFTFDVDDIYMELWLKKNRFGPKEVYVEMVFDLSRGYIAEMTTPISKEKNEDGPDKDENTDYNSNEGLEVKGLYDF